MVDKYLDYLRVLDTTNYETIKFLVMQFGYAYTYSCMFGGYVTGLELMVVSIRMFSFSSYHYTLKNSHKSVIERQRADLKNNVRQYLKRHFIKKKND